MSLCKLKWLTCRPWFTDNRWRVFNIVAPLSIFGPTHLFLLNCRVRWCIPLDILSHHVSSTGPISQIWKDFWKGFQHAFCLWSQSTQNFLLDCSNQEPVIGRINLTSSPRVNEAELEGFVGYGFFLFSYKIIKFDKQILLVRQFNSSRLRQFATLYSL